MRWAAALVRSGRFTLLRLTVSGLSRAGRDLAVRLPSIANVVNSIRHAIVLRYLSSVVRHRDRLDTAPSVQAVGRRQQRRRVPVVWVYWAQGWASAPSVVRLCMDSMKLHAGPGPVVALDATNVRHMVDLPEWTYEKYNRGYIGEAHYSDLLRINLLKQFGGLWMDATLFLSGDVSVPMASSDRFITCQPTRRTDGANVSRQEFTTYLLGGTDECALWSRVEDVLLAYWSDHPVALHYHLLDYAISLVRNRSAKSIRPQYVEPSHDLNQLAMFVRSGSSAEAVAAAATSARVHKLDWRLTPAPEVQSVLREVIAKSGHHE